MTSKQVMPSWASLNERQQQYMQAIYETDQEQEADGGAEPALERQDGMRGQAGKERAAARPAEPAARQATGRADPEPPEAQHEKRMARHAERAQRVGQQTARIA